MDEAESVHSCPATQKDHVPSVGDWCDSVSGWFCNYSARSRTHCRRVMGETESVSGSAAIQENHIHPESGNGQDGVSEWFNSYPTRPHTPCRQAMFKTESVSDSAAIQQDHILAVGGQQRRKFK